MQFVKYQALGNDYIVLDDQVVQKEQVNPKRVSRLCDRHFGVGSDGIIIWRQEQGAIAEKKCFFATIINPDGSIAEKSGNGLRILSKYLWDNQHVGTKPFTIRTAGGDVESRILEDGRRISIAMGSAIFESAKIPVFGANREILNEELSVNGQVLRIATVSIGNPHCVIIQETISAEETKRLGRYIECHPQFPNRINVQFARIIDANNIQIEIWERGAGYTLSSGTSSCAAAAIAHRLALCNSDITVHMPGGSLFVRIAHDWSLVLMGVAEHVMTCTLADQLLSDIQLTSAV